MFPKKLTNRKAIAILRVSSHRQDGNSSHDIQEEKIRSYCIEHQLDLQKIERITESAKQSEGRKKYAKCIDFALRKDVHNLLFYMNDREARNLIDNEKNELLVRAGKLTIHYVNDRKVIHKDSPASEFLMRDFQAVQNKNFSRVLSEKVNDAMRKKAEDGWFPGNRPTLGYAHQKGRDSTGREQRRGTIIVPDPHSPNVELVRKEFELRAFGMTFDQIHEKLLESPLLKLARVGKYSRHGIEARLKNKFYWGKYDWFGIEYSGKHELIIEPWVLKRVKESHGIKGPYSKTSKDEGIFSGGWLRCGHPECNLQIVYDPHKSIPYYRCSNSRRIHPKLKYVQEKFIWEQFEKVIEQVELTEQQATDIYKALVETDSDGVRAAEIKLKNHEASAAALKQKSDRIFDLFVDGKISQEDYERQRTKTSSEIDLHEEASREIRKRTSSVDSITTHRVFELATHVKSLWKAAGSSSKQGA